MHKRVLISTTLLLLLISISFIILNKNNLVNAAVTNGTFTTTNEAPLTPYNVSIQQFTVGQPAGNPKDFDYFDFNDDGKGANITDTHMVYNSTPAPALNWTPGIDPNSDPVKTLLCISTLKTLRDSVTSASEQWNNNLCDVVNNFTNATAVTPPFNFTLNNTKFYYNLTGENITYYVRMASVEGIGSPPLHSVSFYDANITVINSRPSTPAAQAGAVPAVATHSNRPLLNWTPDPLLLDPDNGTWPDHFPMDNVTYIVNITEDKSPATGLSPTTFLYNNTIRHISEFVGSWPTGLTYNTTEAPGIPGIVRKTYLSNIEAWDQLIPSYQNYTTKFDLFDNLPNVTNISMIDTGGIVENFQCPGFCSLTPVSKSNVTTMQINVTTDDLDGDCTTPSDVNVLGGNFSVNAHLCVWSGGLTCNEIYNNFTFKPDRVFKNTTTQCSFSFSALVGPSPNIGAVKVAFPGTIPFFIPPAGGIYPPQYILYVNVTSQSGVKRALLFPGDKANTTWIYKDLEAFTYLNRSYDPALIVALGGGAVTLGSYNPGTDEYNFTNVGNIVTDFRWNASNAECVTGTCTGSVWNIGPNGANPLPQRFLIDDESQIEFLTGAPDVGIPFSNLTNNPILLPPLIDSTVVFFNYTTGLQRCIDVNCNAPFVNEVMPTHLHINPPIGLLPGTYRSIITYLTDRTFRANVQHI